MANNPVRVYWDTVLFLYHFNSNNDKGYLPHINAMLAEAEQHQIQIYTSVLTISEAAFIEADLAGGRAFASEEEIERMWRFFPAVIPVPFTEDIARRGRSIRRWQVKNNIRISKNLNMLDIMHMATAVDVGARFIYTAEPEWDVFSPHLAIPILRPDGRQRQLALPDTP